MLSNKFVVREQLRSSKAKRAANAMLVIEYMLTLKATKMMN